MKTLKIFISYGSEDLNKVKPIYNALKNKGYTPWLDKKNLLPGQNWKYEIVKAIEESHFFLACLSKKSVDRSGYVQKELKLGLDTLYMQPEGRIYLLPVRLEECDVPGRFERLHWCDMFDDNGMDELLKAIEYEAKQRGLI